MVGIDIREDACRALKDAALPDSAGEYIGIQADVTNRSSLHDSLAVFLSQVGPPSILVNNAVIYRPPSAAGESWRFEDIPDELSASVLDVNAAGVLKGVPGFLRPRDGQAAPGSIINIGSLYGVWSHRIRACTSTSNPTRLSSSRRHTACPRPAWAP